MAESEESRFFIGGNGFCRLAAGPTSVVIILGLIPPVAAVAGIGGRVTPAAEADGRAVVGVVDAPFDAAVVFAIAAAAFLTIADSASGERPLSIVSSRFLFTGTNQISFLFQAQTLNTD